MKQYKNVNELWGAIVNGDMDPSVSDFFVTGASYIYQTTQFPNSINKYHNYYLLLRVGTYFGACSHVPEQLGIEAGREFSGKSLKSCVIDPRLPVRIAAMDAYLGTVYPHERQCSDAVELPGGTPAEKADFRDNLIADIANIEQGMRIALIGVVNPLIAAIRKRGGTCLPCDLQMERTQWGDPVEKDMEKFYKSLDVFVLPSVVREAFGLVLCEAMYCGVPVVTTNSGAQEEIIENGQDGIIVSAGDVEKLFEKLKILYMNLELRKAVAFNGKKKVLKNFDIKYCTGKLLIHYQEI